MGDVLLLVAVTESWLLWPLLTDPKSSATGESRSGAGVDPPRSVTNSSASEASERISSVPERSDCAATSPGVNCTASVQLAVGCRVEQAEVAVKSAGATTDAICSVVDPLLVS